MVHVLTWYVASMTRMQNASRPVEGPHRGWATSCGGSAVQCMHGSGAALFDERVQQADAEEVAHLAESDACRLLINGHNAVDCHEAQIHGEPEADKGGGGQASGGPGVHVELGVLTLSMVVLDRKLKVHRSRRGLDLDVHECCVVSDSALVHIRHMCHVDDLHHTCMSCQCSKRLSMISLSQEAEVLVPCVPVPGSRSRVLPWSHACTVLHST